MKSQLSIGETAAMTGVTAKTIRYYEETGLLPQPQRSRNGYRSYGSRDVHILRFIKRARDLGFSVEDVGKLLELWKSEHRESREVRKLAQQHLESIQKKIADLRSLEASLRQLVDHCHGDDSPDCPILEDLAFEEPET